MRIENSVWADRAGQPARFTGLTDTHRAMAKAPEWAYCPLWRFEEIRLEAWFLKSTMADLQGGWGYPVEKEEGVRIE